MELSLDRDVLMRAACAATGEGDWGDDMRFLEPLDVLIEDLRTTADLNEQGVQNQCMDILRLLVNRLGFERDKKAHPEILEEEILPPIIILGLPRTGTSKLQRTIAADPRMQRLEVWRLVSPSLLPGVPRGTEPDPRIAIGEQFEATLRAVPGFMEAHPMEAREPDEELWLLELTFGAPVASQRLNAPNHRRWIAENGSLWQYEYMKTVLQYLQWQDGGQRGRRWVLKSPVHLGELEVLTKVFPEQTFVHCHREPRAVIGSYCSLIEVARRMNVDEIDRAALGADVVAFWAEQTRRHLAQRASLEGLEILDVDYERIGDDVDGVIAHIYARAGLGVTDEARAGFRAYEVRRPAGHFGAHKYDPDRWGVTREVIAEAFADYLDAFPQLKEKS